jgi:type IV pilus assembly protein PilP
MMQRITNPILTGWRGLQTLVLAAALLSGCADPDLEDLHQFIAANKAASPGKKLEPLPKIEPYHPFQYTAQGIKDPFAMSEFVKNDEAAELARIGIGIRPNPERPREELEKYSLGSLQMVGTFTNTQMTELWALVKAPDGIVHRVRPGNHLGNDHGRILNITDQRIDLLEIVPDNDRGWKERNSFLSLSE